MLSVSRLSLNTRSLLVPVIRTISLNQSTDTSHEETDAKSRFRSGIALAIAGTFLFALKSIVIKLAFAQGADATLLLTIRMGLAMPFYVFVLYLLRTSSKRTPLRRSHIVRALLLGFLGYYLASYLDLLALENISAQLERLTLFTYPAMVAVLAWLFLGEQINRRIIAAIALSYFGVWLMYGQERTLTDGDRTTWGVLLVIGAALSYSFYVVFAKPTMQHIGSRQFTSLAMIGSACFVAVHFVATRDVSHLIETKPIVYLYGLFLAFVCTVLPSYMINEAIMRIGATRTTVVGSVGPVLTMGLAIFLLREPTSIQHVAGMLVALVGVSLVATKA